MKKVLDDIIDGFVAVYLDNVLIFSDSATDHINHLTRVLKRLSDYTLYLSPRKYCFMQLEVDLMGLILGSGVICVNPAKGAAMGEWPIPETSLI